MDIVSLFLSIGCILVVMLFCLVLLYRRHVKRRVTYILTRYREKSLHMPYY